MCVCLGLCINLIMQCVVGDNLFCLKYFKFFTQQRGNIQPFKFYEKTLPKRKLRNNYRKEHIQNSTDISDNLFF